MQRRRDATAFTGDDATPASSASIHPPPPSQQHQQQQQQPRPHSINTNGSSMSSSPFAFMHARSPSPSPSPLPSPSPSPSPALAPSLSPSFSPLAFPASSPVLLSALSASAAHMPASVHGDQLVMRGKLMRRDRTFKTWKWRDFYLERGRLQYFSEKGQRKGEVALNATTPIVLRVVSEPKPFTFLLFLGTEKLTLAAATAADRQRWLDVWRDVFHANIEDCQRDAQGEASNTAAGLGIAPVNAGKPDKEKVRARPTFLPIPEMDAEKSEAGAGPGPGPGPGPGMAAPNMSPTETTTALASTERASESSGADGRSSDLGLAEFQSNSSRGGGGGGGGGEGSGRGSMGNSAALDTADATAASSGSTAATTASVSAAVAVANSTTVMDACDALAAGEYEHPLGASVSAAEAKAMALTTQMPKFIALKEQSSNVTFPRSLGNGDVLVGVGPLVRRMGWTDERILAVGLYVDAEAAAKDLVPHFQGHGLKSLHGDQAFYDHVVMQTTFRRSFVLTARKRVSKTVLAALLHDEIAPRIGGGDAGNDALTTLLGFLDKSLRKAQSVVFRITPDSGRIEFRDRSQQYPPIASTLLCQCVQAVFFDVNSIQQDAKRGLIERFPQLWGAGEEMNGENSGGGALASGVHATAVPGKKVRRKLSAIHENDGTSAATHGVHDEEEEGEEAGSESEEDDDDDDDDPILGDEEEMVTDLDTDGEFVHVTRSQRKRSMKEHLDDLDEEEHELLRRQSRSFGVRFGTILDRDSNARFPGDLMNDGSTLLGTWSQTFKYFPPALSPTSPASMTASTAASTMEALADEESQLPLRGAGEQESDELRSCIVSVGLYAESGGASEALLKYKGLSVGSILQDPDFFTCFAGGTFVKHLVFQADETISVDKLIDLFTCRIRRRGSAAALGDSSNRGVDNGALRVLMDTLNQQSIAPLGRGDKLQVSIVADGKMTVTVHRAPSEKTDESRVGNLNGDDGDMKKGAIRMSDAADKIEVVAQLAATSLSTIFQGIFYGYHTVDPKSRVQLMERLPALLDLAKDDLAHTYHDEIELLRENYKRQPPEFRLKAGYLQLSFEKMKMTRNADGVKEPVITASRWSKRWCRLDGATFSYSSHKRSKKAREIVDLTECTVAEITADSTAFTATGVAYSLFAAEKNTSHSRPSIHVGITKPSGELLAFKTENIHEGDEWLEALVEASHMYNTGPSMQAGYVTNATFPYNAAGEDPDSSPANDEDALDEDTGEEGDGDDGGDADVDTDGDKNKGDDVAVEEGVSKTSDAVDDTSSGHDRASALRKTFVERRLPSSVESDTFSAQEKPGSLVAWVCEDSRHALIFTLIMIITWLVMVQEPQWPTIE